MRMLAETAGFVTGFRVCESDIFCACGKELLRIDAETGRIRQKNAVFGGKGVARLLVSGGDRVFVSDFCTLWAFCADTLEPTGKFRLGEDLRSDICGLSMDENRAYCSIRNGGLISISNDGLSKTEGRIGESSSWSVVPYGGELLCGTVDGRILAVDAAMLTVTRETKLDTQNIRSLYLAGDSLYAASQSKKLFRIDPNTFEVYRSVRNAHAKMFDCAGVFAHSLVTVSHPCGQIAIREAETLETTRLIETPLRLSGQAQIVGNRLYISSRNLSGIGCIPLA